MGKSINRPCPKAAALRTKSAMATSNLKTPAELAKHTGMNRITLGAYLRGERLFSFLAARKIAKSLDVDPDWLYWGDKREESSISIRNLDKEVSPKQYTSVVQTLYSVMGNELIRSGYDVSSAKRSDLILDLAYTMVDELIFRLHRNELAGG